MANPLTKVELLAATKEMAVDQSPGPDGYAVEFYIQMWETIGDDFIRMIQESFKQGNFLNGMNKRLIVLLHKGGQKHELFNFRLITLLNVSYKIVAKTL